MLTKLYIMLQVAMFVYSILGAYKPMKMYIVKLFQYPLYVLNVFFVLKHISMFFTDPIAHTVYAYAIVVFTLIDYSVIENMKECILHEEFIKKRKARKARLENNEDIF